MSTTVRTRTRTRWTRESAPAHLVDPAAMDAAIVRTLERHGPQDPLSLLHRVEGKSADIVDAVVQMVVARRLRVDERGRFALPGVRS